jgi:SAM-dependent methyltransferase
MLDAIGRYYSDRIERFGPTPAGVDWNSGESQTLRFNRLLEILVDPADPQPADSLIDYGCGYGAMADYLEQGGLAIDYCGFDISRAMITAARSRPTRTLRRTFTDDPGSLRRAAFAVASGIFNVKLDSPVEEWKAYVWDTIEGLDRLATRGFSFNMLSMYSDPSKRRSDLFYMDPLDVFGTCQRRFSPRVSLLHDYPLYEFTILVRK